MSQEEIWVCWYNIYLGRYCLDLSGKWTLKHTVPTQEYNGDLHQPDYLIPQPKNPGFALFTSAGPGKPGVFRVNMNGAQRPTPFCVDPNIESPSAIAYADGNIFVADNPTLAIRPGYYKKGIVILTENGTYVTKINVPEDVSDYVTVVKHDDAVYFATNIALYRIEKNGKERSTTFTAREIAKLPEPFCRGLASHNKNLYLLCRGEGWGIPSVLYRCAPAAKTVTFTKEAALSRGYTGIDARSESLLLSAFFSESAGDVGDVFEYDLKSKKETRIISGDYRIGTENPLGIQSIG